MPSDDEVTVVLRGTESVGAVVHQSWRSRRRPGLLLRLSSEWLQSESRNRSLVFVHKQAI